jgi:hypothetical protein
MDGLLILNNSDRPNSQQQEQLEQPVSINEMGSQSAIIQYLPTQVLPPQVVPINQPLPIGPARQHALKPRVAVSHNPNIFTRNILPNTSRAIDPHNDEHYREFIGGKYPVTCAVLHAVLLIMINVAIIVIQIAIEAKKAVLNYAYAGFWVIICFKLNNFVFFN